LVYSEDLIHSFTIPIIGVKIDTNFGRINSQIFTLLNKGLYYGSCVENCGYQDYNTAIEIIDRLLKEFIIYIISLKGMNIHLLFYFILSILSL